jgi:hypothetical protein
MRLIRRSCLIAFASVVLQAQDDPSWKNKPIPQWDDQDAKQVLANSPWVKNVKLDKVRDLSKFERRDGGNWGVGIGPTVEFGATGFFGPFYEALALERAHRAPRDYGTVVVRWASARPIRAAESKAGGLGSPTWDGDYYALAVYDIPPPFRWNLANELKQDAFLQRDKKKDLKPTRVVVSRHEDGLATIVYLFPRSATPTEDHNIRFVAQIGRLWVSQYFFPEEMQFLGRPEL